MIIKTRINSAFICQPQKRTSAIRATKRFRYDKSHNKAIFSAHPGPNKMSWGDIEIAYETCVNIPNKDRIDAFIAFGIDGVALLRYFSIVKALEDSYNAPSYSRTRDNEPKWMDIVRTRLRIMYTDNTQSPNKSNK